MREKVELEAKWSLRSESGFAAFRAEAVSLGARPGRSRLILIKDTYLDTREDFFGRRRVSCRLRNAGGSWELTLKSRTRLKKGVASRKERTCPLGRPKGLAAAMRRVRTRLQGIPGRESLRPVFTILNRRSVLPLRLPGGPAAECSFDRIVIRRGKRSLRMLEIELEFLKGRRERFGSFVRALRGGPHFFPAARSKVATALAAFSLERPASGDPDEAFALACSGS
ncbi:MAG: CYTH domain-containing protein [Elusimicrobia bacterium]|nr:CYTH domain-containing protein [Elusimicrobiota bacterium]